MLRFKEIVKRILSTLFRLTPGRYLFYFLCMAALAIAAALLIDHPVYHLLVPLAIMLGYEASFRCLYLYSYKKPLPAAFDLRPADIPFEAHPYLPWVHKKNYVPPSNRKIYDDARQGYMVGGLKTNNLRHINGPDGGRNVIIPKPEDVCRILCLGDSATSNYASNASGALTSWPLELEKCLAQQKSVDKVDVINCGQGGYNTNEILAKFIFDTIDTEPDIVILYHAFVNVRCYLTPGFERDYSHFRRTMSRHYPRRVAAARLIPDFGLWSLRFIKGEYLSYLNIKEDHVRMINKTSSIDRQKCPEGLETFRRNLETLIHTCKGRGIQLIMSTYQHYLYPDILHEDIHIKFHDTVMQENDIIKELANNHGIPLVDNQARVPADSTHYLDMVHPTAEGMALMAKNFCTVVTPFIERRHHAHS